MSFAENWIWNPKQIGGHIKKNWIFKDPQYKSEDSIIFIIKKKVAACFIYAFKSQGGIRKFIISKIYRYLGTQ